MVGGGTPVVFVPFGDEEDRAQVLVRRGGDGAFTAAAHDEGLELQPEDRLGTAGGISELTEEPAVSVGTLFDGAF